MGTSTNALLVYGFRIAEGWGQYPPEPEEGEEPSIAYQLCAREKWVDGIGVVDHCSLTHPMFILTSENHYNAYRGYPEAIDPSKLEMKDPENLRSFATKHEIPIEGEPEWWLCSYWTD